MEHKYLYILCPFWMAYYIPLCQTSLLPSFRQFPAKPLDPYLWPSLLPGKVNNQMQCPNSCPLGRISCCPSLWSFTHAWFRIRGVNGKDLAILVKLQTSCCPTPTRRARRSVILCKSNTWHNTGIQSIKIDVFHFYFPNLTDISLMGTQWREFWET